jgi:hypothetical protein
MLLDEDYLNFISDDFKKKYENLISSKLIFFKNYQLANHVNEIWDEVDIWWESKAVQNSLKLFNSRFNEKGNCKSLQLMSTIIKKNI